MYTTQYGIKDIRMRVIAGRYKGRKLFIPKSIRPTKDNVKESLFNVLSASITGARVLELFSGSGSLGIEALSRGAKEAVFVDNNRICTDIINRNLLKIVADDNPASIRVLAKDACAAVKFLRKEKKSFDIVILDPPYNKAGNLRNNRSSAAQYNRNRIRKCLKYISVYDILPHSGIVVVEHFKKDNLPVKTEALILSRQLKYSDTILSIYKKA